MAGTACGRFDSSTVTVKTVPMQTRDILLEAGLRVFSRHGYRRASMSMVAEEAGLTRQAVYHHFASKEQLFSALVDMLNVRAHAAAATAVDAGPRQPMADRLVRALVAHQAAILQGVAGSLHEDELMAEGMKRCGGAVELHARRFEQLLASIVRHAVASGEVVPVSGSSERQFISLLLAAAKGIKVTHLQAGAKAHAQALGLMVRVLCRGAFAIPSQSHSIQMTGHSARRART